MHSAHTIWGAMGKEVVESDWVENFPFLVFVFEAGWCQVPIWNEGWPQGGSRLEMCWPKPDQFDNKLQMSNIPQWSTNILTTSFWSSSLFQIYRQQQSGPARHTACGISFMKLSLVLCLHRKSLMSLMPCPTSPMSLTLGLKLSSVLVLLINSHCYWCCIANVFVLGFSIVFHF